MSVNVHGFVIIFALHSKMESSSQWKQTRRKARTEFCFKCMFISLSSISLLAFQGAVAKLLSSVDNFTGYKKLTFSVCVIIS